MKIKILSIQKYLPGIPVDSSRLDEIAGLKHGWIKKNTGVEFRYHAGNEETMRQVIQLCLQHGVNIGAHPSFMDKENFGRTEMNLPAGTIYNLVTEQLKIIAAITVSYETTLHHVKPHGALYNLAVKNEMVATEIAKAVHDFDPSLIYYALPNSAMLRIAEDMGLKTASEVFADRTYQDDGTLTPRTQRNAMLTDSEMAARQVLMMAKDKKVTSLNGKSFPVKADTICIHGDLPQAYSFAKAICKSLKENKIDVKAI